MLLYWETLSSVMTKPHYKGLGFSPNPSFLNLPNLLSLTILENCSKSQRTISISGIQPNKTATELDWIFVPQIWRTFLFESIVMTGIFRCTSRRGSDESFDKENVFFLINIGEFEHQISSNIRREILI